MLSLLDNEQYASSLKVLLESGRAQELMKFLEDFTKERTLDIQQVCGTFYQVFGDFDKLSSLEKDAEHAKEELEKLAVACAEAEKTIRQSSQVVTDRFSLMHNRDVAMQAIDTCLALLDELEHLQHMVDEKDKLSEALYLLKKIQVTYVNPLSGRVDFVRHVASQLPKVEASLTRQANSQVKAWMTLAWEACQVVGANEMATATKNLTRNAEIELATRKHLRLVAERAASSSSKNVSRRKDADSQSAKENPYNLRGLASDFEEFQLFSSRSADKSGSRRKADDRTSRTETMKVMKDLTAGFKSLAEAVFVSQQLGTMNAVSEDYYETKNLQIPKLFQNSSLNSSRQNLPSVHASSPAPQSADAESRQRFTSTLETVAGFFAIETDVSQSFDELLSNDQLQDLWRTAVVKCKQIFMNEFGIANSREEFLAVLKTVLEFITASGMHRFDSHPLLECVSNSSSVRYCEIEFQDITARLAAAHAENTWEPVEIRKSEDLQRIVYDNGLPHKDASLPQVLSFSSLIPFFFEKLKDSIDNLFALSQYFGDVERLITKHADVCFQHFIRILAAKPADSVANKHKVAIQKLADLTAMCDTPQFLQDYVAQRCIFGHKPNLEASKVMFEGTLNDVLLMCKQYLNSALDVALDAYSSEWTAVLSGTGKQTLIAAEMGVQLKKYISDTESLIRRLRKDQVKELRSLYGRIPLCVSTVLNKGKKVKWSVMHLFSMDVEALLHLLRPIEDSTVASQLQQIFNFVEFLLKPDESKVVAFLQSDSCPMAFKSHAVFSSLIERIKSDSHSPDDFSSRKKACIKVLSRK